MFELKDEIFAIEYKYANPVIIKSYIVGIRTELWYKIIVHRYMYTLFGVDQEFQEEQLFKTHEEARQKLMAIS